MSKPPIRYADTNVVFDHGQRRAAVYQLPAISYPLLSDSEKERWLKRLAGFAARVGADFTVMRVNRAYSPEEYLTRARLLLDERYADPKAYERVLAGHAEHLTRSASWTPEIYLVIDLRVSAPRAREVLGGVARLRRGLEGMLGISADTPIGGDELEALISAEKRAYDRTRETLPGVRRATTREIQWLLARAARRGVSEPRLDRYWEPDALVIAGEDGKVSYRPRCNDIARLTNAPVLEDGTTLAVDDPDRVYQAMLGMCKLPERAKFPGDAEFLYHPLESVSFPVDLCIHVRWISNKDALTKARHAITDADNEYLGQTQSDNAPMTYEVFENREVSREVHAYFTGRRRPPLLDAAITLAVGARTPELLDKRVDALLGKFGHVTIERPGAGLQRAMYRDMHLRADGGSVRDYEEYLTIEQFGALMFAGTHHAGAEGGLYWMHTVGGARRPIRFDFLDAQTRRRKPRPPSILMAGAQGAGKTFAAQLLGWLAFERGSLVIDVDPKPDHGLSSHAEVAPHANIIELSGHPDFQGKLDPLVIGPEGGKEDLAHAFLTDLAPREAWDTPILRAIQETLRHANPGCLKVIDHLKHSPDPEARAAGEALEVRSRSGLARLGFSDGTLAVDAATARMTHVKAQGLDLPEPGTPRSEYDPTERVSVAVLKLLAAYAMRLVTGDKTVHKVVIFDEAWFLLASPAGRRLIARLNRMGRAQNATIILASQDLLDVSDVEALFGTRVVFGFETDDAARRAITVIGLDPEDPLLVEKVKGMLGGHCLIRDIDGRVAEGQIDSVFAELLDDFDSTPNTAIEYA